MLTIVYIGSLPHGHVKSFDGAETFPFVRGQPVKCSPTLASELVRHDPSSWKVADADADVLQEQAMEAAKG